MGRYVASPRSCTSATISPLCHEHHQCQVFFNYVLTHATNDKRPYLEVTVLGYPMHGLLDSGASRTIVGSTGWRILQQQGLTLNTKIRMACTVANGQVSYSLGVVQTPFTLQGRTRIIDVLVVPDIPQVLILGIDFWRVMGIMPNLRIDAWHFTDDPETKIPTVQEQQPLTTRQRNRRCPDNRLDAPKDQTRSTFRRHVETDSTSFVLDSITHGGNANLKTPKRKRSLTEADAISNLDEPSLKHLTIRQKQRLKEVTEENFDRMGNKLGCTNLVQHVIETTSSPIKQRYYPANPKMQEYINAELNKMLDDGVVEPSDSAWSSPILLVRKKTGDYRFVVDFRKLNSVTKRDAYPLPFVAAILDKLKDAKYLSSLDLKSAYWQVPLSEKSKELTAFTIPGRGLFQFRRMPMGLHNSAATWQRLMDRVIGADLDPHVFVYLDDIVIVTPDFDSHVRVLEEVFNRLIRAGLTLSRDKCKFCMPELKFLGYVVNQSGLNVDPDKVSAIVNVPIPTSVTEVRRFLGMASWYRRFVPDFASTIAPLTSLLKKNSKFIWTNDCSKAFATLKNHLVSAPILNCPDFSLPFVLQTDASAFGIGAVLTQPHPDGERVICYASRSLSRNERNYSVTERECLAVLWAIEKLRGYLEGYHFSVITDHHSLVWLHKLKEPTGRLARWAVRLQQYDFSIIHRKGKDHVVPDLLSRSVPLIDLIEVTQVSEDLWYNQIFGKVRDRPAEFPDWRIEGHQLFKLVHSRLFGLLKEEECWKRVLPRELRQDAIHASHDVPTAGHLGVVKTVQRLAALYYWPQLRRDVTKYVRNCGVCARYKVEQRRPAGLMGRRTRIERPWQVISIDIMGPLPRSSKGNVYLLVVADCFSKFPLLFPMRNANAKPIAKLIEDHVFLVFGVPQFILADNGVQFRSHVFSSLVEHYDSRVLFNAHYHPQANPTERINRVLKTMMASYVQSKHTSWDVHLPEFACAIRTAKHSATGLSPYFVNFGREMVLSGKLYASLDEDNLDFAPRPEPTQLNSTFREIYQEVGGRLDAAYEKSKRIYDLRRRPVSYQVGDLVFRRNFPLSDASRQFSAKLAPKFLGPFKVKKKLSTWTYELEDLSGRANGTWHVQDLKPGIDDSPDD